MEPLPLTATILFGLILVLNVVTCAGQVWFLLEIRRLEPRAWRLIASPAWLKVPSFRALWFVQVGHYQRFQSKKLRGFGAILRSVQRLNLASILLFVAVFAAMILRSG
jgi:hypothetical protein